MSVQAFPAPARDRVLQILREAAGPVSTAEIAERIGSSVRNTDSKLCKMRLHGFITKTGTMPLPPRPPGRNLWTIKQ